MQMGEPHPHFYGHEEIWCEIKGKSLAFYGSQVRMQHPGEAYMLRPDKPHHPLQHQFEEPGSPTTGIFVVQHQHARIYGTSLKIRVEVFLQGFESPSTGFAGTSSLRIW